MRRWHQELPLLERRLRQDQEKHRGKHPQSGEHTKWFYLTKDGTIESRPRIVFECNCELGTFRKRRVWGCRCSRTRGGCKYYKAFGNAVARRKFTDVRRMSQWT